MGYTVNISRFFIFLLSPLILSFTGYAQVWHGQVLDKTDRQPLPFATIRLGGTTAGMVTDMNGFFTVEKKRNETPIEISYLGYVSDTVLLDRTVDTLRILLQRAPAELQGYIFRPPYEKIRRILDNCIARRKEHHPEQYPWYRCHVYYKMIADILLPDSTLEEIKSDTGEMTVYKFLTGQHLLLSETYSIRTWEKPQKLQEEVRASRLSGFKKSLFTSLITDVLPFHAYSDYLTLNGKDYHNPVSKGYASRYDFHLQEELIRENDTIWQLGFRPKSPGIPPLSGSVYISSDGYAIAYLLATAEDVYLKRKVKIEHQYGQTEGKWFPRELNYIIDWQQETSYTGDSGKVRKMPYTLRMNGRSVIDSISWEKDPEFRFDKSKTVKLLPDADERDAVHWGQLRPVPLQLTEEKTYRFNDSLMEAVRMDRFVHYLDKITEGKFPVGPLDLDLKKVYRFNRYEGSRWGLGIQTNEKLFKYASLGGWAGYGHRDFKWKYGGFLEIYPQQPEKDFLIRASWERDLKDPGSVQLHPEIDHTLLRMFLLYRADLVESIQLSATKRIGYGQYTLSVARENVQPQYAYARVYKEAASSSFTADEISLQARYAYAERRVPLFGRYYSSGSRYPVLYGKLKAGRIPYPREQARYLQLVAGIAWEKHINRIGKEHLSLMAGKSWSNAPLPLSKLFAGNGLRFDQISLYTFGGMLTLFPYEYYSDRFLQVSWKHDFDRKLYHTLYSSPFLSIAHNLLWGDLKHPEIHRGVDFGIPSAAYHESGLLVNNIIRIPYMKLYYLTFNIGYFYHWKPPQSLEKNGRLTLGLGFEL